jgi:hypothetical protein
VLAAVAERVEAQLQAEVAAAAAASQTNEAGLAVEAMAELVRQYWAVSQGPGASHSMRLWLELVLIASRDPDRLPGFLDRAVSGWTQVIESSLGDRPDADTLAALVFATMTGLEVLQLMQPGSARANQALEKLIDVFQRELRGKEPG